MIDADLNYPLPPYGQEPEWRAVRRCRVRFNAGIPADRIGWGRIDGPWLHLRSDDQAAHPGWESRHSRNIHHIRWEPSE